MSAHADQDELVNWAETASPKPDIIYVNHGEPDSSAALAESLGERADLSAVCPQAGERVRLDV